MQETLPVRIQTRKAADIAPVLASKIVPDAVLISDFAKTYRNVAKSLKVSLM